MFVLRLALQKSQKRAVSDLMFEGRQLERGDGENLTVLLKRSDGVDCSVTVRGKQVSPSNESHLNNSIRLSI